MAHDAQLRWGVPLGRAVRRRRRVGDHGSPRHVRRRRRPRREVDDARRSSPRRSGGSAPAILLFGGSLYGGQSGVGPQWLWGVARHRDVPPLDGRGLPARREARPVGEGRARARSARSCKRHGFWVLAAGALLYFPAMGLYSLWDPWETHYGEVAREILARDDWISLWWAQDGWFWSKPVLNFWIQSIAMATLGTHYKSDQMLLDSSGQPTLHPEWVVRAPNVLFTLARDVPPLQGRREGLRAARGAPRRARPRDDARLVLPRAPDDDRHAVRRVADGGDGAAPPRRAHRRQQARARLRGEGREDRVAPVGVAPGLRRDPRRPRSRRSSTCSRATSSSSCTGAARTASARTGTSSTAAARGTAACPGNEAARSRTPRPSPRGSQPHPDGFVLSVTRLFGAFEPVLQGLLWAVLIGFVALPELGRAARAAPLLHRRLVLRVGRDDGARGPKGSASRRCARSRGSARSAGGASSCASRS